MSIMGRDGKFSRYEIGGVNGNNVTLKNEPEWVRAGTVFAISTASVAIRLFRILSVAETENNSVYSITASLHDPNKQAIVDEGAVFEVPSDTLNGYRVPNVENLRILNTNTETVQVTATWETATTTKNWCLSCTSTVLMGSWYLSTKLTSSGMSFTALLPVATRSAFVGAMKTG